VRTAEELAAFLRARRAALQPADVGYPTDPRRRVTGLRREEVAVLAGISVDYYVRLEQGRVPAPSRQVVDALARALRLDATQSAHLRRLADPYLAGEPTAAQTVRSGLQQLLDAMHDCPAFVLGRRTELLACNALGTALHGDPLQHPPRRRAMAWLLFFDDGTRRLYPDWEDVARDTVGALREDAGRHPHDLALRALVSELCTNDLFRRWWNTHHVHGKAAGTKRFSHPVVGPLTLHYEALTVAGESDQLLIAYTATPGSRDADTLALLGAWAASTGPASATRPGQTQVP
jgi:transcriptional regulator with XRE-family HTH domain